MATFYYGGSGTDPLIRIEVYETLTLGTFNVIVTQVQATDADAFVDPNGNYYLGDLRAFYLDFASTETFAITNFKGYATYDATGTVVTTSPTATKIASEGVTSVGSNDTNMNGSGGGSYDAGIEIGTQGIGKDEIGSVTLTVVGTAALTFADFLNASFGIRVTSVGLDANVDGDVGGSGESQTGSSKISYETPGAPDPAIVTIGNASALEGGDLLFSVTLSNASALPIDLNLSAAPGSASAGEFETTSFEYSLDGGATWLPATGPSGTIVTIPAGATSFEVRLNTTDDVYAEGPETMTLGASVITGSVASIVAGTGTITDSVDTTTITLSDVTVVEGSNATITASVDHAPVGSDLVIALSNGATITIAAGELTGTSAPFLAATDDVYLDAATYPVSITGTSGGGYEALNSTDTAIVSVTDDADPVTVSLAGSSVTEGASVAYTFTATLSHASQGVTTITTDQGVIQIQDNQTVGTLVVPAVNGDDVYLDATSLTATITAVSGGNFENLTGIGNSATAHITDTIDATTVSIGDVTVNSGSNATINATVGAAVTGSPLVVHLSNGATVTIPVGATGGTSTSFTPTTSGTVSILSTSGGNYEALDITDTAAVTVNANALYFRIQIPGAEGQDRLGFDNFTITIGATTYTMADLTVVDSKEYYAPNGTDDFSIGSGLAGAGNERYVVFQLNNAPVSANDASITFTYTSSNNGNTNNDGPIFSIGTSAAATTMISSQIVSYSSTADWTGNVPSTSRTISFDYSVSGGAITVSDVHDPIILDLGAAGIGLSNHVMFDMDGDGRSQSTAWTTGEDGILVMDLNGNGSIDSGLEIFSPGFNSGTFADALDALASLDSNADGLIDAADSAFDELRVWIDADSDGVTDDGELMSLSQLDIACISLGTTGGGEPIDGQSVLATGTFLFTDGGSGNFAAVELEEISNTLVLAAAGAEDVVGTDNGDVMFSTAAGNLLNGAGGDDQLYGSSGNDILDGGNGKDVLVGGGGRDSLTGGLGADSFMFDDLHDFVGLAPESCDIITDFSQADGDRIDLCGLDANALLDGDQGFQFIGSDAFGGNAGELRYEWVDGNTYVMGDINGDSLADFMMRISGVSTLQGIDFWP